MKMLSLFTAAGLLIVPSVALAQTTSGTSTTTTANTDQKTYTEEEIRQMVKTPSGPTTDVRRVGQPNQSTLDKGSGKSNNSSTQTTPSPTPPENPSPK